MKKVFLDGLPRWEKGTNKGKIDWDNSINCIVNFIYDDISGEIKILKHNKKTHRLVVEYNSQIYNTTTPCLIMAQLSKILGLYNDDYIYSVNQLVETKKSKIRILEQIRKNNKKWYVYKCINCNCISEISENNLMKSKGCPVCTNQKVIRGINDIGTTHPHLAKYFVDINDTYKYSYSSGKKVLMKCPNCGTEKLVRIGELYTQGFSCPKCSDGISFPNKFIFNVLEQLLGDNFETEFSPRWCKYTLNNKTRWGRYDFYFKLEGKEYIIEADGGQHKNKGMMGTTLETQQFIDFQKDELAKKHNIEVIRVDCEFSSLYFIKNSILNSKLNLLFNLKTINWNKCLEYCCDTLVKTVNEMWNNLQNTLIISEKLKLNRA